jgi:trans-aconitate methyltransferase
MSRDYWESRYQTGDMRWEKGGPSPGLVDFLAAHPELRGGDALVAAAPGSGQKMGASATMVSLPTPTVCVPGCGTGHDVREFARAGFDASGFDIAPSAIRLSQAKTMAAGLKARFQLADFLHDEPPQKFDWLFEHTLFCVIQPQERDDYVRAVLKWLKPDGQYLAVNYLIPDEDGPPFGTTRDELWRRFSAEFNLVEEVVPRSYPNRTGLELLLWWRRKAR